MIRKGAYTLTSSTLVKRSAFTTRESIKMLPPLQEDLRKNIRAERIQGRIFPHGGDREEKCYKSFCRFNCCGGAVENSFSIYSVIGFVESLF